MRQGRVFYKDNLAGLIIETDEGDYIFQYDDTFIELHASKFITFTMPVTKVPYTDNRLFPFFEGLIPEGWLLDIASKNWKINRNDRLGLLLTCCRSCIGAVSVVSISEEHEK